MLLSAEAARAAQKANLENNLEMAQHALQDKQQVGAFSCHLCWAAGCLFENICHSLIYVFSSFASLFPLVSCTLSRHLIKELNKAQKKLEEEDQRLKERHEQCTQLDASLKEGKDKLMASEQRVEQLEGLNKVCNESLL